MPRRIISQRARRGAVLSMELLLVLPVVLTVLFGLIEFSMVWTGAQRVQDAAKAGCRIASLPGSDELAVRHAVEQVLQKDALIETYELQIEGGEFSGDEVAVRLRVPMDAAAPNLLMMLGYNLEDRHLKGLAVMRRE